MIRSTVAMIVYAWIAAFIWHLLPDMKNEWWALPAIFTTVLLGFCSYWFSWGEPK